MPPSIVNPLCAPFFGWHSRTCQDVNGYVNGYVNVKEALVSAGDKMSAGMDKAKGKIKEAAGKVTDDERLEAEGKLDQAKGDMKSAGEKAKDAAKDVFGK